MLSSGSPMGKVVEGSANPVTGAAGAVVEFKVRQIQDTEDLETALGIDVEASYGCGAFGGGATARFNYAKSTKVQSNSLFMMVTASVELAFESIDAPVLTSGAKEIVDRTDVFEQRYGDMFVRGVARGGIYVGTLQIITNSTKESIDVAAHLEGTYGLFALDASAKFKEVQQEFHGRTFVDMYHEGGPVNMKINSFTDPMELLRNANEFLESFQKTPEEVARPYFVTLAPIAIAEGSVPPNAAEIQRAQDVLVYCAKRRSALLDIMNLADYILDHAEMYEAEVGVFDELRATAAAAQKDLDLLADCASVAMNDRTSAKLPTPFAEERGETFPLTKLPEKMPVPKFVEDKVELPDFRTCTSQQGCHALAKEAGLNLAFEYVGSEPESFKVLDFRPPVGTFQPRGSTVTISCPPSPPPVLLKLPSLSDQLKRGPIWMQHLHR